MNYSPNYISFHHISLNFPFVAVKPTSVGLREKPTVMVAEHEYSLICEAWGSRPQAQLTWLRENSKFRRGKVSD